MCWSVILGALSPCWKGVFWTLPEAFRTGPPSYAVHSMKKCQPTWRGYLGYRFALLMGHEADDGEDNKPGEHWGAAVYTGNDQGVTAKKNEPVQMGCQFILLLPCHRKYTFLLITKIWGWASGSAGGILILMVDGVAERLWWNPKQY